MAVMGRVVFAQCNAAHVHCIITSQLVKDMSLLHTLPSFDHQWEYNIHISACTSTERGVARVCFSYLARD